MVANIQPGLSVQIVTVVAPVAVYFLVLGLLNSRRRPQLLTGRQDFALLITALSPLPLLPLLSWLGATPLTALACVAALGAGVLLAGPRGNSWVIYHLSTHTARRAVAEALASLGEAPEPCEDGFALPQSDATVDIRSFSLLQNVTVVFRGADRALARRFGAALSRSLADVEAETSPAAVALLVVATAMLVAPLALVAHRAPEIVRLLTDLLK